jgi:uncharacterized FlaG/YvyC family protein
MEISPITRTNPLMPADPTPKLEGNTDLTKSAVAAVRALNKSELFGEDRQLLFTRDADTRKPVVRIVSRKTGEVLDQIPPEAVLKIMADLGKQGQEGPVE